MPSPFRFRAFEMGDVDKVLDLLRVSLGESERLRRTHELFSWKHLENPFGRSIMLVAEARGDIVGFRSFMRWELLTPSGETLEAVRPVDTATHPDFRRQGIFRELTLLAVEIARSEGVDLVFNTPNAKSGAGYRSMGWSEVGKVRVQVRPSRRLLLGEGNASSVNGAIRRIDHIATQLPDRAPLGLRTPRDAAYRSWRFQGHPAATYLTVGDDAGAAVLRPNLRNGRRELVVSDLYGPEPDRALAMVRRLASRADYLIASFPEGSPERAAVSSSGLRRVPWLAALQLHAYPLRELPLDATDMESWDISLGDLELL